MLKKKKNKEKTMQDYFFTSESVSEGHPDKVCDRISDAVVDLYLSKDPNSRTAVETLATTNRVFISGETSSNAVIMHEDIVETVRKTIKEIGYTQKGFNWQTVRIDNFLHSQSSDIALGVNNDGAGDQGIMFGYACKEEGLNTHYMPLAIFWAHKILQNLSLARHNGEIPGIEPDAKSQVTLHYAGGIPVGIAKLVVSTQHIEALSQEQVREIVTNCLRRTIPQDFLPKEQDILVNPTGRFVVGGPDGDTGLTGRKIIVDTYGGYAPHGGGAFSGKDATKVDRSAAYMLRYLAKNVVAAGLADKCLLQLSYAIGLKEPLSFFIDCRGTARVDEQKILHILKDMVDLSPKGIIRTLGLNRPIYTPTSSYGHFGRTPEENGCFSWEKTDLSEKLKKCF